MITKASVAKELVKFYREYKDHMDIEIYYDYEEKKLVSVIDNDESYLRSGAECECIVTYEQNWTNNCQLELKEFLDAEEIPQYLEWMKKKYNLDKYESEFIGNMDDVEDFLDEKFIEEKFYERLEAFFEYYLEDNEIYKEGVK